jgi:membrane protein insertase Oxa1/YidC/SpoIIIJ
MVALYHSLMAPSLSHIIPLQNEFLWLNMAQPDPYYILPALVVATTWFQQKLMTPATPPDSKDASSAMSRNMMITMPLLFGLMSLQFAAGLSIYFIVSNLAGILQYALYNRTGSISAVPARVEPEEVEEPVAVPKKSLPAPSGNKASNKLAARRSAVEAHRKKKPGGPARGVTRSPATGSTATGRTKAGKAR